MSDVPAPTDPLQALLASGAITSLFPANSRYAGVGTATMRTSGGRTVVYLRRRFIPRPERFATVEEHTVTQGERPDLLAAEYLGDPELAWRLCDANGAMRPSDLTDTIGRRLRITLPEGIPGVPNA